jgi:hypothetical protein
VENFSIAGDFDGRKSCGHTTYILRWRIFSESSRCASIWVRPNCVPQPSITLIKKYTPLVAISPTTTSFIKSEIRYP